MPDITMCMNDGCPLAGSCYRHEAKPNEYWQSFAMFEYQLTSEGTLCDNFIEAYKTTTSGSTQPVISAEVVCRNNLRKRLDKLKQFK